MATTAAPASRAMLGSIGVDDLPALIAGGEILGSGGGGDLLPFAALVRRLLADRRVPVIASGDLEPDAAVVPVGIIGATVMLTEKLPSGHELAGALTALTRWTGAAPSAVMSIEVGGVNTLTAIAAAAALDLPLVDADLVGRAMPRLDQFTLAAAQLPVSPCALYEPGGATTVLDGVGATACEGALRAVVSGGSGWGALAIRALATGEVAHATVTASLHRALTLGSNMLAAAGAPTGGQLAAGLGAVLLGGGRVQHTQRRPARRGLSRTTIVIQEGQGRGAGPVVRIEAENEYLAVLIDGQMVATCPDPIVVVDRRTRTFVRCEAIGPGQDVWVLALPAPRWWTATPDRLAHVGPRAFGIDTDPVLLATW